MKTLDAKSPKRIVTFENDINSFTQKLSTVFGLSTRVQKSDGNKGKIYIGRKTFSVTFGKNFIRIAKEGSKIQIPYSGAKNTVDKLSAKIEEFRS